jgi:hypothetical protein
MCRSASTVTRNTRRFAVVKVAKIFDLSQPDAEAVRSPMGGGWIIPLTPDGSRALSDYFDAEPMDLAPLGGRMGYIVEPSETADIADHLRANNCAWVVK